MTRVSELFGVSTADDDYDWQDAITTQQCPFAKKKCYKVRKSDPDTSIGTCTVAAGKNHVPLITCPNRFLERSRIFVDSMHLLTSHEPGNDLHVLSEKTVPGGSVDYVLVSARDGKVRDFVGIELQALDTTGTVWPERERFLRDHGLPNDTAGANSNKRFGINWKMTAKTILVQLHHKIETFEHFGKKLVLAAQDHLYDYMDKEFSFSHVAHEARLGDSMHFHSYALKPEDDRFKLAMKARKSTDSAGVAQCLGLQGEAKVDLEEFIAKLEASLSPANILKVV